MPNQYVVRYGRGREIVPPFLSWETAFQAALVLHQAFGSGVSVINADRVDVCPDTDCDSCNRDGLTDAEREALSDAGIT